jgi:hypothetical protein
MGGEEPADLEEKGPRVERERERERDRVLGLGSSAKITASGVGTRPLLLGDSACVVQTRARRYSARGEDYRRVPQRAA